MNPREIGREPELTPVGSGIVKPVVDIPTENRSVPAFYEQNSFWSDSAADLFKDQRARRVGDILTVRISISDQADLDNSSERSKDATHDVGVNVDHDVSWRGWTSSGDASLGSGIETNSEHKGAGAIARSENIKVLVAAVVTGVLPNGNLVIHGSQEVRVNYELRVLTISGVVHSRDINSENMVSYERIAEARISYGGRGRLMEVQQPGWGQQIVDSVAPF